MVLNTSAWEFPTLSPDLYTDSCNYTSAWLWLSSLQPAYLLLVSLIGVLGNGLVLAVFCLHRSPCSAADIYLGNLAVADLTLVTCLPFWAITISLNYQWSFGLPLCKLVNLIIAMNYYCSVMFLVLVSMDRYLALVKPMFPSRLRRPPWAKRFCLVVWALGFLLSLPALLYRTVRYFPELGVEACYLAYPYPGWRVQRNLTSNLLGFLVPLPVVAFCTRHMMRSLQHSRINSLPGQRLERRATHLVLTVLVVFIVCWTPYQVMRFLDTLDYFQLMPGCLLGHVLDIGVQLSTYFAYGNSAVNPFLYVIVGTHFRKRAKGVFKRFQVPGWKDHESVQMNVTIITKLYESPRQSCKLDNRTLSF